MNKYKAEKVLPYNSEEAKTKQVSRMFDSIAITYDKLNITLSFGIDRLWRRAALSTLKKFHPKTILDVATGTGDLAILTAKKLSPDKIIGVDISQGMLNVGKQKVSEHKLDNIIDMQCQDCLNLNFEDNTFDAITIGFGARNFESLEKGYAELLRVLKPGGVLMVLELSTPQYFPMKQLFSFYSSTVIPFLGKLISKDKSAYTYLNDSVKAVAQGKEMEQAFLNVGFSSVSSQRFTFGICSNYIGIK